MLVLVEIAAHASAPVTSERAATARASEILIRLNKLRPRKITASALKGIIKQWQVNACEIQLTIDESNGLVSFFDD